MWRGDCNVNTAATETAKCNVLQHNFCKNVSHGVRRLNDCGSTLEYRLNGEMRLKMLQNSYIFLLHPQKSEKFSEFSLFSGMNPLTKACFNGKIQGI